MKNRISLLGIIAILAIIGLGFTACGGDDDTGCNADCLAIGATGEGGGKIIYHKHSGFTVTGADSFTAYYLEAAPTDQSTGVSWSSTYVDVTGATGYAIGTGKSNTAAIIAAHPGGTASNNAAKAAVAYTGGGKSDWFLPSQNELVEMYKARTYLDISSGSGYFWSSSQHDRDYAYYMYFADGFLYGGGKLGGNAVRAVRAF